MREPCSHELDQIENDRQETSRGVSIRTVLQCVRCGAYTTIDEFTRRRDEEPKPMQGGFLVYSRSKTVVHTAIQVTADNEADAIRQAHELIRSIDLENESSGIHSSEVDVEEIPKP